MRDDGQGAVTVLGLLILSLMIVGLAVDTTRAVVVRRGLQSACDAGALSGASMISQTKLRSSGGRTRELEPRTAESEALRVFALQAPLGAAASASADTHHVVLTASARVTPTLLALAGLGPFDVPARCVATPR